MEHQLSFAHFHLAQQSGLHHAVFRRGAEGRTAPDPLGQCSEAVWALTAREKQERKELYGARVRKHFGEESGKKWGSRYTPRRRGLETFRAPILPRST